MGSGQVAATFEVSEADYYLTSPLGLWNPRRVKLPFGGSSTPAPSNVAATRVGRRTTVARRNCVPPTGTGRVRSLRDRIGVDSGVQRAAYFRPSSAAFRPSSLRFPPSSLARLAPDPPEWRPSGSGRHSSCSASLDSPACRRAARCSLLGRPRVSPRETRRLHVVDFRPIPSPERQRT